MHKFLQIAQGDKNQMFGALLGTKDKPAQEGVSETAFFESVATDEMLNEAAAGVANTTARADAMAVVLAWYDDGDDAAEGLDAYAQALADSDEDGEIGEPEEEEYHQFLTLMADAMVFLGVPAKTATDAMKGDDAAAAKAMQEIETRMNGDDADEDDLIVAYSTREAVMNEAKVKVVRGGKVKFIQKPLRKKIMSAAQKAALRKARRKAHTGAAKVARRKSMKARKSRGM